MGLPKAKWGVAYTCEIPLIKRAVVDYAVSADYTPQAGDVKVVRDGGSPANIGTLPTMTASGNTAFGAFTFSASEMQNTSRITCIIGDAATKAVEDQMFVIEMDYGVRSNTAQGGASTSITFDAAASSTTDFYVGMEVELIGGTGAGQKRFITAYNGTSKVATVHRAWATNPDSTSIFRLDYSAEADMAAISKDGAAADNLETMLDGTGGQQLSLGKLVINNGSGIAVDIDATGGVGIAVNANSGNNSAVSLSGSGAGAGLRVEGGATGTGLTAVGGSTSGGAINLSTTDGHGFTGNISGSSKFGFNLSIGTDLINDVALSADAVTAIQSGLGTAAELAKVPKSDGTVTWNATALASINTQADTALADAKAGYVSDLAAQITTDHGAGSYIRNTEPPTASQVSTQVAADLAAAHGAGSWATATGFSTHSATDVWAVATRSLTDKAGFSLSATGLDSIPITAPAGVAATFREMLVQVWRRFFKRTTLTSTELKTYADNGSTVNTTQNVSDDGTTQIQGPAT